MGFPNILIIIAESTRMRLKLLRHLANAGYNAGRLTPAAADNSDMLRIDVEECLKTLRRI
jgi:hypothetical protein